MSRTSPTPASHRRLRPQIAQVILGPWPIRPVLTGVLVAMVFQYASADINSLARLDPDRVFGAFPLSIARGAAVGLPMWAAVILRRWITGGRPLTRISYLAIIAFGGFCSGTVRFWLSDGDVTTDVRIYAVFILRATFLLLLLHITFGMTDARWRSQVRRADRALAEVERQQRIVLESEERTKDEVSKFLHNRVQAGLVAIGMQLRQLESIVSASAAERVSSIRDALERVRADDVRQASRALSPDISTIGLPAALRDLGQRYAPGMSVAVTVTGGDPCPPSISPEHLLGCYRIVEQGLLNAGVHGRASMVDVVITITPDALTMDVRDDGIGPPLSLSAGTGTAIVDAWVGRFGGAWTLRAEDAGGALLHAVLPAMRGSAT